MPLVDGVSVRAQVLIGKFKELSWSFLTSWMDLISLERLFPILFIVLNVKISAHVRHLTTFFEFVYIASIFSLYRIAV